MTPQLLQPPHLIIAPELSSVLTRQLNRADHITTKLAISFNHQDYFHTVWGHTQQKFNWNENRKTISGTYA